MMAVQLAKAFAEFKVRGLRSLRSLAMLPSTGIVNESGSVRNQLNRRRSRASDGPSDGNSSRLPATIRAINSEIPRRRFEMGQQTTDALNQRAALRNDRDARNASRKVSKAIADLREVVQPRDPGGRIKGFREKAIGVDKMGNSARGVNVRGAKDQPSRRNSFAKAEVIRSQLFGDRRRPQDVNTQGNDGNRRIRANLFERQRREAEKAVNSPAQMSSRFNIGDLAQNIQSSILNKQAKDVHDTAVNTAEANAKLERLIEVVDPFGAALFG